jgi:DNA-binding NtrC family response regulator
MPHLVVLEGPNRGAIITVDAGESRIGRDPSLEIALPDKAVSRRHALLRFAAGAASLSDLGSKNATFVNGIRVIGDRTVTPGDEIRLGETTLLFAADESERAIDAVPEEDRFNETATIDAQRARASATAAIVPQVPSSIRPAWDGRPRYIVGESAALARISELVARCAPLDTSVLITGESGTGKELVAEALHRGGSRRAEPFVVVNCANLEPALLESDLFGHEKGAFTGALARKVGKLEIVRGGTLFLDEVGELPLDAQAKLLRALDRREFQRVGGNETLHTAARFVAATHRDLSARVREGRFREDLLFRLRVVEIQIPPLRERPEDIAPIAAHLVTELRERIPTPARTLSPAALDVLRAYPFRGNVRELRNILERCLIFSEKAEVSPEDLPLEVRDWARRRAEEAGAESARIPLEGPLARAPAPDAARAAGGRPVDAHGLPTLAEGESGEETQSLGFDRAIATLAEVERGQILRALELTHGNKTRTARLLGIDRNTLNSKMRKHGLEADPT